VEITLTSTTQGYTKNKSPATAIRKRKEKEAGY
jgi:hypothetical protein